MLAIVVVTSVIGLARLYRDAAHSSATARRSASVAEARLFDSYIERGRTALVDGNAKLAPPDYVEAARRGVVSDDLRFMLERAAEPRELEVVQMPAQSPRAWQASYSADGERLLTSDDSGVYVWSVHTAQQLLAVHGEGTKKTARFSPDETKILAAGPDGVLDIWRADSGALVRSIRFDPRSSLHRVVVSPDASIPAMLERGSPVVTVADVTTGAQLAALHVEPPSDELIEFSPDQRWLAAASGSHVRIFDTSTWKLVVELPAPSLSAIAFAPTEPKLLIGTERGELSLWAIPSGRPVIQFMRGGDRVRRVAISPDGRWAAMIPSARTGRVFRMSAASCNRSSRCPMGSDSR